MNNGEEVFVRGPLFNSFQLPVGMKVLAHRALLSFEELSNYSS